jgi:hypothetical protein
MVGSLLVLRGMQRELALPHETHSCLPNSRMRPCRWHCSLVATSYCYRAAPWARNIFATVAGENTFRRAMTPTTTGTTTATTPRTTDC